MMWSTPMRSRIGQIDGSSSEQNQKLRSSTSVGVSSVDGQACRP